MAGLFVVGDLGGTNCRLELLDTSIPEPRWHGTRPTVAKAKYPSTSAPSLTGLVQKFLAEPDVAGLVTAKGEVALFSIAVCGPVTDGKAVLLAPGFGEGGWRLDAAEMAAALGATVLLLNDFHSVGLGLPAIPAADLRTVYDAGGHRNPHGVRACLGPGTGLGEVFAIPAGNGGWTVCPSEGSMSDFCARTDDEWAFRQWIAPKCQDGFVEVERVASGEGIANLYNWLRETRPETVVNPVLDATILSAAEPAGVIGQHCTTGAPGADALCVKVVDMFLDALGAEAGNMAIRYQASGGVYIAGGGIANKLLDRILDGRVAKAFMGKGHSTACFDKCPLFVATTPGDELGMMGAYTWAVTHAPLSPPP